MSKFADIKAFKRFKENLSLSVPSKVSQLSNDLSFVTENTLTTHTGNNNVHLTALDRAKLDSLTAQDTPTYATIVALNAHVNDTSPHVSSSDRNTWNSKANGTHSHAISDITNLQSTLNSLSSSIGSIQTMVENNGMRGMSQYEIEDICKWS